MGSKGFNRQWVRHAEQQWYQHARHGGMGGPWGGWGPGGMGRPGSAGPPPWVAGLFGLAQGERGRGPRVRRGDVRSAILDVVHAAQRNGEEINGYQVIQQIAERSNGAWRPSPGSVYPTVQQLEDEELLETVEQNSRRSLRLTASGEQYVADHADQLAEVWAPFADPAGADTGELADLRPEIGLFLGAMWQIVSTGSDAQRRAAVEILVDTRRKLYGVLADGDPEQDTAEDA